jgi:hypothetical protein
VTMRSAVRVLATAMILTVCAARGARAESYFNPWAGVYFGDVNSETSVADIGGTSIASFGANVGDLGSKLGGEITFGFSPDFYGANSHLMDLMGGFTAGPLIGRSSAVTAKPYFAVGAGLLRTSNQGVNENNFGFNAGGGLVLYFSTHFGIRGEARYFRTVNGTDLGDFHFTRAQFGLMIR